MVDPTEKRQVDTEEFVSASHETDPSFLAELVEFLRDNKRWWLWPIVISLLVLGALVILNGTGAAPFVYTFF